MTIDEVLGELVDHGFEDLDEDRALAVINETLSDAAARELWPQLLTTASLTFAGGFTPIDYPADVGTIYGVYRLYGRGKSIPYRRLDDTREQELTGYPAGSFYTLRGTEFRVYGSPEGSVGLDYFRVPAPVVAGTLEADIWLPPRFHREVIVNGAVYKLYLMEDDVELSREFERLYEKAFSNIRAAMHMQNLEDDYIHVVDAADWDYE